MIPYVTWTPLRTSVVTDPNTGQQLINALNEVRPEHIRPQIMNRKTPC